MDFAYCHTEDLWEEIGQAIEKADMVLLLMSKDYQDSKSCRQEVMYTKDSLKKKFIPIYVKKEFTATGWLGVRIVGPQYIRFGKKSFESTIKELVKLILEDTKDKSSKTKDSKASPATDLPVKAKTDEQTETVNQDLPKEENEIITTATQSNFTSAKIWNATDIANWFDGNKIRPELKEMYDFQCGTELLLYGQCLKPDWQSEYLDVREQYSKRFGTTLYRNEFVRLVTAFDKLEKSQTKLGSSACDIL